MALQFFERRATAEKTRQFIFDEDEEPMANEPTYFSGDESQYSNPYSARDHYPKSNYPDSYKAIVMCLFLSDSVRLLVRQAENSNWGQGLLRERFPGSSQFSKLLFLDIPGIATEQIRTCGFRTNSLSSDKVSKMRDSVRLKSWESLLVTLPSISLEIWVMYS